MKRVREEYLSDPVPSTSKAKPKSPFKVPTPTQPKSKPNTDKISKSDEKSAADVEDKDPDFGNTDCRVSSIR